VAAAGDSRAVRSESLLLENLTLTYGGVTALESVSISVGAGTITGLIGPNGAGKTTAMDAICGFTPYSGRVVVGDLEVDGMPPHRRVGAGLGRTFQGLDLYEDLTVGENVVVGQYATGSGASDAHLDEVLQLLELWSDRERNVGELSQGHRQLVSIARALAGRPSVLLLDEPAAGLDTSESEWLADRLRAVRDSGATVLLVDHDMNLVLNVCEQIHVLDLGRLIASGTPEEIRQDPAVNEAYLGSSHSEDGSERVSQEGVPT
jgi:sulfate-transporting ATPase